MKEVILSALLLFIGRVAAEENPLGDIITALPGFNAENFDTLSELFDVMAEGGGDGDGDSSNLFDGLTGFLSDLNDGKDVDGQSGAAADGGVDAPGTSDILVAVSMLADTGNLEQLCDAGFIPSVLVKACAKTDGISDGAAITGGAVAGGVGGAAGAATAMEGCDFVNCCVKEEDVVTSSTRSRFEGCKASLPDFDNLASASADAAGGIVEDSDPLTGLNDLLDESSVDGDLLNGIGEDGDLLNDLNDLLDESNFHSETPEEDLYNSPELRDPSDDGFGLGFSAYENTGSRITFSSAPFLTLTAIISTVLALVI